MRRACPITKVFGSETIERASVELAAYPAPYFSYGYMAFDFSMTLLSGLLVFLDNGGAESTF